MTKKKKVLGVAGIAAVALIGGTFAYFSQTTTVDNPFDTAKYGTVVVEDFNPEEGEKWQPGAEVNKDLYVDNTGDRDVVVRVKFEDIWHRDGETPWDMTLTGEPVWNPGSDQERQPGDWNNNTWAPNGEVTGDKSVVDKIFDNNNWGKWTFYDGYFYYKEHLKPGMSTDKFLDSVKLNEYTDMGDIKTQYYIAIASEKPVFTQPEGVADSIATFSSAKKEGESLWIPLGDPQNNNDSQLTVRDVNKLLEEQANASNYSDLLAYIQRHCGSAVDGKYSLPDGESLYTVAVTAPVDGEHLGYSDAQYTLRITVETVQATDVAVSQTFFGGGAIPDALKAQGLNWSPSPENLSAGTPEEDAGDTPNP